jgi:hypothetical protein
MLIFSNMFGRWKFSLIYFLNVSEVPEVNHVRADFYWDLENKEYEGKGVYCIT